MSRPRLAGLAVAAVALIGAVAWAVEDPPAPRWNTSASTQRPAVPSSPSPSTRPATGGATEKAGPAREKAGPAAAPAGKPARHKSPAPFIQSFAAQPGVTRHRPKPRPAATTVPVAITVDGCDHNYGTRSQCIPVAFPGSARDKCAWLNDHGYRNVKVVGTDKQRLDADRNGVACDR